MHTAKYFLHSATWLGVPQVVQKSKPTCHFSSCNKNKRSWK